MIPSPRARRLASLCCVSIALWAPAVLEAVVRPEPPASLAAKERRHPDLAIRDFSLDLEALPLQAAEARRELAALGVPENRARIDPRSRRWATLILHQPLPGVAAATRSNPGRQAERAAVAAVLEYLAAHRGTLRIDPGEIAAGARATALEGGEVLKIHAPRLVGGVPVRGSRLTAVVRHGNLVLLGLHRWGDVHISTRPRLSLDEAQALAASYLDPLAITGAREKPELILVPLARGRLRGEIVPGRGYTHRLAWAIRPTLAETAAAADDGLWEAGAWEILVDAHSGEILSFEDTRQYATAREVRGGVYPVSNDGAAADGIEQAGWPMPFARVTGGFGSRTTDGGGNVGLCVEGEITSRLDGAFVSTLDFCGATALTGTGDLDFGTSAGADCTTPGFGGAGNTHASRTAFHHLNRLAEQGRGQLPTNPWLSEQLPANLNIASVCGASWDGTAVNFYRSATGCANTGELPGVVAHEWGHGLDDNDATPGISSPGEGIADLYAYLRLDRSCIGRGFRLGVACSGYGDPCTSCDGPRDIDWANRASGVPHDVAWADAQCKTTLVQPTPCGGITHCEGAVYAEAVYDLINRDLPALFGMDHATALEVGTRLTYLGAGLVGNWFACSVPDGGCGADGGYLSYLVADDDNGNINDGTPHMSAIFAAFDRHGIACNIPSVVDAGCAGAPATAATVTGAPRDRGAALSWSAVPGATGYQVFRTDGVAACASGTTKIADTSGTSLNDSGLQNGRPYSYRVIPTGPTGACLGPAGNCTTVTPIPGPNLAIDTVAATSTVVSLADGDRFFDNCEVAELRFSVDNIGSGSLTNVRLVSVSSPSHPAINVLTGLPSPLIPSTLAACARGAASFELVVQGLAFNDTLELTVEVTADELPAPKTAKLTLEGTEADFSTFASRTFDFESDLSGWQVVEGTFDRTDVGGGAQLTPFYLASSANLPDQCDHVRSPLIRLSPSSTLELHTEFDIEPPVTPCLFCPTTYFDRANIGIFDVDNGARSLITPDGGRGYNASGSFGTCGTAGQGGWADAAISWAPSTWSSTALSAAVFAGRDVRLDVRYGTDVAAQGTGFHFDQVTLTDFELQVPDSQPDVCTPQCAVDADCDDGVFCNGAERCLAGSCAVGPPPCDDGIACTADSCDEATDTCGAAPDDALCQNGLFCDGAEICDPALGCRPGPPVDCDDGVACTSDTCDEGMNTCDHAADDGVCQNGVFCDGAEICDPVLDCQPASDPCAPLLCDEVAGSCVGQLEAGSVTVGSSPVTVPLANTYASPVVVATVQYVNNTLPVVTRVGNVTANSFDVRLQNPSNAAVAAENVSFLVVEEGSWSLDGVAVEARKYTSTVTDSVPSRFFGELQTYRHTFTDPVVLGQVMSDLDPKWSYFWEAGDVRTVPPTPSVLRTGKLVGPDPDLVRANETVGFLVFETGHGTLGGVEYEAAVGPDIVGAVDDAPPYLYDFSTPFPAAPTVAVLSTAAQEGTDGSWAQVFGATLATSTQLFLANDEDQIADAERNHIEEPVAYAVFQGPVVFPVTGQCVTDVDCSDGVFCNGAERCVGTVCLAGADPCPGQTCVEVGGTCSTGLIFSDDFESGDASRWSDRVP